MFAWLNDWFLHQKYTQNDSCTKTAKKNFLKFWVEKEPKIQQIEQHFPHKIGFRFSDRYLSRGK